MGRQVCGGQREGWSIRITELAFNSKTGIPEFIGENTQPKLILQANLRWGESFFTATEAVYLHNDRSSSECPQSGQGRLYVGGEEGTVSWSLS